MAVKGARCCTLAACALLAACGGTRETVRLEARRELRGAWVASVFNINFPSSPARVVTEQQAELDALVAALADAGLNAVFFQVRPEGDALYTPGLEPWSRFLTGEQGRDPGYDPLAYLIDAAHARAIEVHAWLNPYRAKVSRSSWAAPTHVSQQLAEHALVYGDLLWMDPGAPAVQDHVVAVVEDLVGRYAVDGVHFDDYFYPYPDAAPFPDGPSYDAYRAAGGALSLGDWRRDNVNTLVRRVFERLAALASHVRFGVSPFGIYRPGQPAGITGLDQYDAIYADPPTWKRNGWVDYLAPQLYWPSTQRAQAFGPLIAWWAALEGGQPTYAGCNLEKLGSSDAWTVDELRAQVQLTRAAGAAGNIFYHVGPLLEDRLGVRGVLRDELYAAPALPPAKGGASVEPPEVAEHDGAVRISGSAWARALYRHEAEGWRLTRVVPAHELELVLGAGRWALSAIAPGGGESVAVVIER